MINNDENINQVKLYSKYKKIFYIIFIILYILYLLNFRDWVHSLMEIFYWQKISDKTEQYILYYKDINTNKFY